MITWMIAAQAGTCTPTTLGTLGQVPAPAVFVLGERKGTQPDLARASRLVARLRATGSPVTVALQAVNVEKQPVLDRYAQGEIPPEDLSGRLDWYSTWGFPYPPYTKLVTAANGGAEVLGVGVPFARKPPDRPGALPPGYRAVLADAMGGHYMPVELEDEFVQTVAWFDQRVAKASIEGWSGHGYLVVLADRTHVEGGKGISWQLQRMTKAPVFAVLLGDPGRCYDGDQHL